MKHDGSGDGLRLLQEHLGHANFNTTAKYRKFQVMSKMTGIKNSGSQRKRKNDKGKSSEC